MTITYTFPASTTTLAASPSSATTYGQPVPLTATVAVVAPGAGTPGGTVTFFVDGVKFGNAPLNQGSPEQATLTTRELQVGDHELTAAYGGDANFGGSATTAPMRETVGCTRTVTGTAGTLAVTSGAVCVAAGTKVAGSIVVEPGAALSLSGATVGGSVQSTVASAVSVCGSALGSLSVTATTGYVLIGSDGDDAAAPCAANTIKGGAALSGNRGGLELTGNAIGGNAQVTSTSGTGPDPEDKAPEVEANQIGGGLSCSGNSPAPTNDQQPNTVGGGRTGQCTAAGF